LALAGQCLKLRVFAQLLVRVHLLASGNNRGVCVMINDTMVPALILLVVGMSLLV
jgi:hypothetical protein